MAWEYIIHEKPPHSLAEAVNNPQIWNSYIDIMDGPDKIHTLPMTERNRSIAVPPPRYYLLEEIRTPEGEIPIEKTVPEFTLAPQMNPFHQIIFTIISGMGNPDSASIYKSIVNEYRVLPDNVISRDIVDQMISTMRSRAYILRYKEGGDVYYVKGKPLTTDAVYLIPYKRGYDPIAWQLVDFIRSYSEVNIGKINYFMMNEGGIRWLTLMDRVDMYLNALEKGKLWGVRICSQPGGNIEKIRENWYAYRYPLKPWGEEALSTTTD